jgi:hypothetical protein
MSNTFHDFFSRTLKWWNTADFILSGEFFHSLDTGKREVKFINCNSIVIFRFSRSGQTTFRILSLTAIKLFTFQNLLVPKIIPEPRKSVFSYPNWCIATLMIKRTYALSGDARRNIEYCLENATRYAVA